MRTRILLFGGIAALALICLALVSLPPIRSDGRPPEWRRATASDSVPRSIAEAEAQGERHPRSRAPAAFPSRLAAQRDIDTAERRCVEVGTANVVRAGDVLASPFALYRNHWHAGIHPPGKVSWFGGHVRSSVPMQLIVRVTRLDTAGSSHVWVGKQHTLSWGFATILPYLSFGFNNATTFDLPAPGRWLLLATIDHNWGCFVYSL
jgi:hypothetical protein